MTAWRTHPGRPHMRAACVLASVLLGVALTGPPAAAVTKTTKRTATTRPSTTRAPTTIRRATTIAKPAAAAVTAPHEAADDLTWSESSVVTVTLADGATKPADGVSVAGNTVTITSAGTYRVRGALTDGQLAIDAKGAIVRLLLEGVSVRSTKSSAINVLAAETVVIVTAAGTTNRFADATTYVRAVSTDTEPDAALFSKADLTLAGDGVLEVTGNAGDAIASKDGLLVAGGTVTVVAADDGIRGKDYVIMRGGAVTIDAKSDGIKATEETEADQGFVTVAGGTLSVKAGTDGIDGRQNVTIDGGTLDLAVGDDAVHAEKTLEVRNGTIDVTRSREGLEGKVILIKGGTIRVAAEDDAINVGDGTGGRGGAGRGIADPNRYFMMTGGTVSAIAPTDGLDINGDATITGGLLVASGPTSRGSGAIDADGTLRVTGGVVVAAGSARLSGDGASQPNLTVGFNAYQDAGTVVQIRDASRRVLVTFQSSISFVSFGFSSPAVRAGATYTVHVGGKPTGSSFAGYFADSAPTSGAEVLKVSA